MTSKHTPGPWKWDNNLDDLHPLWEMGMSQGFGYIYWLDQSSKEANARLIAMAPRMYEVLCKTSASILGFDSKRLPEVLEEIEAILNELEQNQ